MQRFQPRVAVQPVTFATGAFRFRRRARGGVRRRFRARRGVPRRNLRVGGFTGVELKFADSETVGDAFAVTWAPMEQAGLLSLSAVAVGDTESERIGRIYDIFSVHVKGFVNLPSVKAQTSPGDTVFARVALVLDTQTNGAQLTAGDVFDEGQGIDHLSFRNLQHTTRFKVLWDRVFTLSPNHINEGAVNAFATGGISRAFKINKTFNTPIKVHCTGITAVIASIATNSLHIIGIASTTAPTLDFQARIRFKG